MALSGLSYEGRFISIEQYRRVHVMEFGDGKPLILVHGAGSGGPGWHRQIAALASTRRVIVPDIPLFGISDIPSEIVAPRKQIADVILGLMDHLGIATADIAGHSMGAVGTVGAMIREPQRFNRAMLISSPGFGRGLNPILRVATVRALKPFIRYDSRRDRGYFFDHFEAQKSGPSLERELWKDLHFHVGNRNGATATFRDGLRVFTGLLGQRDVVPEEELEKITTPTQLVWGDSDRIIPTRHGTRAVETIPGARLEIIENCGHIVQLEAPDRLTELMLDWFSVS